MGIDEIDHRCGDLQIIEMAFRVTAASVVMASAVLLEVISLSSGSPDKPVALEANDVRQEALRDSYREGYFKAKGRAAADQHMSHKLQQLRAKEHRGKKRLRKQDETVLRANEAQGKKTLRT